MLSVRPAKERGHVNFGWLDSRHSFSFGGYHDPRHMGFGQLRVINDDRVAPGAGFETHPHRDMEIVSYVVDGAMEHRDSLGHGSVIRAGEVQRMTAGTGVLHSEFNHSATQPLRFLQLWLLPERRGLAPGYEQREFPREARAGELRLVVSPNGRDGSLRIHSPVEIHAGLLRTGEGARHALAPGRRAWLQVVNGSLELNGTPLHAGDGAALEDEPQLAIQATQAVEFLLFDMAAGPPAAAGTSRA